VVSPVADLLMSLRRDRLGAGRSSHGEAADKRTDLLFAVIDQRGDDAAQTKVYVPATLVARHHIPAELAGYLAVINVLIDALVAGPAGATTLQHT
jgi:hypothetical protein